MREYNAIKDYPQPHARIVGTRSINHRIMASYRSWHFFDCERDYGYGGLIYDGRWKPVAQSIVEEYKLVSGSSVLQLNCEKGFLLHELHQLGVDALGVEPSAYARRHAMPSIKAHITPTWTRKEPVDLLIALGVVYTLTLPEAMECLRRIEQSAFRAFVTLASYETQADYWLFKKWSLLASTILKKQEWVEVLRHVGYSGDYCFVNAETLKLSEPWSYLS